MISAVSETGGHLGSSLGVVELTVAIHAVFNTPADKLIFDVGHQCYPHKVLTGRRDRIRTLRQEGGLSGFTKRSESVFDPFGAAHSSTSISAALGFAMGREMGMATGDAIAVIGDGAISAGMAYEAMNHAGDLGKRLFVILNDNEMSIAPPVGAMSKYLSGLNPLMPFAKFAEGMEQALPGPLREGARRARALVTGMQDKATLFEQLGFSYIGPVDGHDMGELLAVLRAARVRASGPVLIHAITKKGKGYAPAESSADKYHGVAKFDVASGEQKATKSNAPSYTKVFGQALAQEALHDSRIVAITAAMPSGTGRGYPGATDAEPGVRRGHRRAARGDDGGGHGGLGPEARSARSIRPSCSAPMTRWCMTWRLQGLPVRFAIDRAGLVGADGATHAGAFDVAYLSNLPGFTVMAAADEAELMDMVATAAAFDDGPIAFRYPRGDGVGVEMPERGRLLGDRQGARDARRDRRCAAVSWRASVRMPCGGRGAGGRGRQRDRGRRAFRQAAGHGR